MSQFIATPSGDEQYGECIAVSTTGDATGTYYLYEFLFGPDTFYDYPKLGVWPDGYYMMANEFPSSSVTSSGTGAFVFERSKMLNGQPARVVFFDEAANNPPGGQWIGQLPADLDGSTLPPAGSPNYFAEVDDPAGVPPTSVGDTGFDLRLWNSTSTGRTRPTRPSAITASRTRRFRSRRSSGRSASTATATARRRRAGHSSSTCSATG
jgi:hypothetical protein